MAKIVNWKLVLLVIGIFSISIFILPGVITESMAADNPVVFAGLSGGAATASGMSMGAKAALVIIVATIVSVILSTSDGGDPTVTHP
ncbi:MAG: hypothetical protein L0958_04430 [Candidatus Mariimomonas ferrooxydans]